MPIIPRNQQKNAFDRLPTAGIKQSVDQFRPFLASRWHHMLRYQTIAPIKLDAINQKIRWRVIGKEGFFGHGYPTEKSGTNDGDL